MNFNINKNKNYLLGIVIVLFMLFLLIYLVNINSKSTNQIQTLEAKWHVLYNGTSLRVQPKSRLEDYVLPKAKKGDLIEFQYRLEDMNINNPGIVFDTWHCKTEVFLEDNKLYSWGANLYEKNKYLGSKRHKIALPQDYGGKILRIKLTVSEPKFMSKMESVAVFPIEDTNIFWFKRPILFVFFGIIFLVVSLITFIFSCVTLIKTDKFISSVAIGATLFIVGLYFLSRAKIIPLIIPNPSIYNQIEFLSIFLLPLTLLICSFNIYKPNREGGPEFLYESYLFLYSLLLFSVVLLHNLSSIHYSAMVKYFYLITVLTYIAIYYILEKAAPKNKGYWIRAPKIMILVSFFASILATVFFNTRYFSELSNTINIWLVYAYILSSVSLVILVFFFIGFYINMKNYFILEYENLKLSYIARHDMVTMIENRSSFNEKLEYLKNLKNKKPYSIIVIDLNELKKVNDTYGHTEGDKMLVNLAKILLKSSKKNTTPYRIGGDEFAIIVSNISNPLNFKESLEKNIRDFNEVEYKYKISIALGVASTKDSNNPYEIFNLADKRMYEVKRKMKEAKKREDIKEENENDGKKGHKEEMEEIRESFLDESKKEFLEEDERV